MKKIFMSMAAFGAMTLSFSMAKSAFAETGTNTVLVGQTDLLTCDMYTQIRSENGTYAYACLDYPHREYVADYLSTDQEIRDLKSRVEALERKLATALAK